MDTLETTIKLKSLIKNQDPTTLQKIQRLNQAETSSQPVSKPKSQIPVLDGIRAVACPPFFHIT